ncbi:hypothetical protein RHO12_11530 [Orbus sturtevantii]|uniref:hypothetical protein n=1 Tax=Orbus sturtevantii TaxID=3074109 RepID=UPI00370D370E
MKVFRFAIFYLLLSFFSIGCTHANDHVNTFNFSNYPIKDKSNLAQANFAGHYLVSTYGCGGGAICGDIKNLLTNNTAGLPNAYLIEDDSGENGFLLSYQLDSRLIIISGILADPDETQYNEGFKKRYYHFINDKLILLSSQ